MTKDIQRIKEEILDTLEGEETGKCIVCGTKFMTIKEHRRNKQGFVYLCSNHHQLGITTR